MTKLLLAYDYVKNTMTQQQRDTLDHWFLGFGQLFEELTVGRFVLPRWPDRNTYTQDSQYNDPQAGTQSLNINAYFGGPEIFQMGGAWGNTPTAAMVPVALISIMQNDSTLQASVKRYFKEALMFMVYPQGAGTDFFRGADNDYAVPCQGWRFLSRSIGDLTIMADVFARAGNTELYDYSTSHGVLGTAGSDDLSQQPKSLKTTILWHMAYIDGTFNRYQTDNSDNVGNQDFRIDTDCVTPASVGDVHYGPMANRFFKDTRIQSIYLRTAPGAPGYPASPAGDPWVWAGNHGHFPGLLFMFGQMEDEASPYEGLPVPSDLIAHWRFNDTLADRVGSTDLVHSGTPTYETGRIGNAITLNGAEFLTTNTHSIAGTRLFPTAGNPFTVSIWFKTTATGTLISSSVAFGADRDFQIFLEAAGQVGVRLRGALTEIDEDFDDGEWHHVAVTWDGDTGDLYIDGLLKMGNMDVGDGPEDTDQDILLGARSGGTGFVFTGALDDARIYARALDPVGVETLFNLGEPDVTSPSVPPNPILSLVTSQTMRFSWGSSTDDSGGGLLYHVENCAGAACIDFAPLAITSATHFDVSGLTPGTLYRFRVRAEDASHNFSDYSTLVEATTEEPEPTNILLSELQAAINGASPGTTITVANGTYNNPGVFTIDHGNNCTQADPCTIRAQSPRGVIITGNTSGFVVRGNWWNLEGFVVDGQTAHSGDAWLELYSARNVVIDNWQFRNQSGGWDFYFALGNSDDIETGQNITIRNSEFNNGSSIDHWIFNWNVRDNNHFHTGLIFDNNHIHDINFDMGTEFGGNKIGNAPSLSGTNCDGLFQNNTWENITGSEPQTSGLFHPKCSNITWQNEIFRNNDRNAIRFRAGDNMTIDRSWFENNDYPNSAGDVSISAGKNHRITNSVFIAKTSGTAAINVRQGCLLASEVEVDCSDQPPPASTSCDIVATTGTIIANNTFVGYDSHAIDMSSFPPTSNCDIDTCPRDNQIENNIFYHDNGGKAIVANHPERSCTNQTADDNLFHLAGGASTEITGTGAVTGDPQFAVISEDNFVLVTGSPAISAGHDVTGTTLDSFDKNGVSRPQGAGFDLGAYEFTGVDEEEDEDPLLCVGDQ
jgi:hypothetical protein